MFSVSFLHSYYQTKLPYIYRPIVSVCVCVYVCAYVSMFHIIQCFCFIFGVVLETVIVYRMSPQCIYICSGSLLISFYPSLVRHLFIFLYRIKCIHRMYCDGHWINVRFYHCPVICFALNRIFVNENTRNYALKTGSD